MLFFVYGHFFSPIFICKEILEKVHTSQGVWVFLLEGFNSKIIDVVIPPRFPTLADQYPMQTELFSIVAPQRSLLYDLFR